MNFIKVAQAYFNKVNYGRLGSHHHNRRLMSQSRYKSFCNEPYCIYLHNSFRKNQTLNLDGIFS